MRNWTPEQWTMFLVAVGGLITTVINAVSNARLKERQTELEGRVERQKETTGNLFQNLLGLAVHVPPAGSSAQINVNPPADVTITPPAENGGAASQGWVVHDPDPLAPGPSRNPPKDRPG